MGLGEDVGRGQDTPVLRDDRVGGLLGDGVKIVRKIAQTLPDGLYF